MPKIHIDRSIEINATPDKVFSALIDFNKWLIWSPWLITDPDADVTIAEDGKSYKWDGERVGSGNMQLINDIENKTVHFELNFLKPWKSIAKTSFSLEEENGVTRVTWSMNSGLPFFMFWMKRMMSAFVGADYERGLDMLKSFVEEGEIASKLDFDGISEFEGCKWIGVKTECSLAIVATQMQADFGMLWGFAEENKSLISGNAFTIYNKWDIVKNKVSYVAALPVHDIPHDIPEQFMSGKRPKSRAYKLKHTGDYHHLGNAWSAGYAMMRNKEFKHNRRIKPFEVYLNNPSDTKPKKLVTVVHFPVK
ncbi:MAG: SRPBCC family protein [Ekhidna sp.]